VNDRLLTPFRLLLVVVLTGWLAVILWPALLLQLGVAFHTQWFLDSYAILAANDAVRSGADVTQANALDLLNRPHVYSDWWLGLRWLGLTRADNFLFGGTGVLAAMIVAFLTVRPRTNREALLLAAVLLSPPFLLAMQRANNDLVIFTLVGVAALGVARGTGGGRLACFGAAVVLAAGLKYYPLAAAGALALLPWNRRQGWTLLLTLVAAGLVLFSERDAIGRGTFALPATIYEFGAAVLWRDLALGPRAMVGLALLLLGLAAVVVVRQRWVGGLADDSRGSAGERFLFAVGACLLVGCFVAGTSYFYRWIFGLWLAPWLLREAGAGRTAARVALGLWLVSIWADGVLCLVVNSLGLAYRPAFGWRVATQTATWALLALLSGWLLEGVSARARAWRQASRS
jgi:hypothetical protein